jgi:hypothetical protein
MSIKIFVIHTVLIIIVRLKYYVQLRTSNDILTDNALNLFTISAMIFCSCDVGIEFSQFPINLGYWSKGKKKKKRNNEMFESRKYFTQHTAKLGFFTHEHSKYYFHLAQKYHTLIILLFFCLFLCDII